MKKVQLTYLYVSTFLFIASLTETPQQSEATPLVMRGSAVLIKAFTKSKRALTQMQIKELSKLSTQRRGTQLVGKALGQMALPAEVLEDSYLRIAVALGRLSPTKARSWFRSLRGTPGFRGALSKSVGQSLVKAKGHLTEIEIAAQSKSRGMRVLAIGQAFSDPAKKGLTDIDLIIKSNEKSFAVEVKDYLSTTRLPMDHFRADLDTLNSYCQGKKHCIPVFSITNKPSHAHDLTRLQLASQERGIQLIMGDANSQADQLKALGDIL